MKTTFTLLLTISVFTTVVFSAEIHQAAWEGNLESVSKLISSDPAAASLLDERDCSPLHYASDGGHLETIQFLVQNGARKEAVDVDGDSPLHWACFAGHVEVVNFYLENDYTLNLKNAKGHTPLNYAAARKQTGVVDLLLDFGADLYIESDAGKSLLHDGAVMGHTNLVKQMIQKGADTSHRRRDGGTLLHSAATGDLVEILELLKNHGLDLTVTDHYGRSAADMALASSAQNVLDYLAENGIQPEPTEFPILAGRYLGQKLPGLTPELFFPGVISTGDYNERDVTFSPDFEEFYFTRYALQYQLKMTIFQSNIEDLTWTEPEIAPWSGNHADAETYISPDGSELYFISRRPSDPESEELNWEIWYSDKIDTGWTEPEWIGPPFKGGFYPTMTNEGTLYYTSDGNDIYRSKLKKGKYKSVEKLGPEVNTERDEYNSMISPDESFLIFTSFGFEDSYGNGDLYISFRDENDRWTGPYNLGPEINTDGHEFCPALSPDGNYFFYTSDKFGTNDIFWVDAEILKNLTTK